MTAFANFELKKRECQTSEGRDFTKNPEKLPKFWTEKIKLNK